MSDLELSDQFRLHFEQLRRACNDRPQTLVNFFLDHAEIEAHAKKVKQLADTIDRVSTSRKLHRQIAPKFIQDWTLYISNWKVHVEYVNMWPLLSINLYDEENFEPPTFESFKSKRDHYSAHDAPNPGYDESFDPTRHDGGNAIMSMVRLISDQANDLRANAQFDHDQYIYNTYIIGVEAIEYLEDVIGIDIARVFDRWNRVPAVFVPKHVSDHHGYSGKESLYRLLDEAVRAYVAGAPGAAVAMCRAMLEQLLKNHYLHGTLEDDRGGLKQIIGSAVKSGSFPKGEREAAMKIKKLADEVLHRKSELSAESDAHLVVCFRHLKHWIEKAPERNERT